MFRIRIGHFTSTKIYENKLKQNLSKINKPRQGWLGPKLYLMILLFLVVPPLNNPTFHSFKISSQARSINPTSNQLPHLPVSESSTWSSTNIFSRAKLGVSVNKIQKIVNGNRRSIGYKLAVWNCGRGLLNETFSSKLLEIKQFIQTNKPHCFGVIESDLYGQNSPVNRRTKYTTEEIKARLKIDGYSIEFPQTWLAHGQARLICYVSDDIKYSRKPFGPEYNHIPSITLEIGIGRAARTTVHYYYREWKNGVTREEDNASQVAHHKLHINQWEDIASAERNFVCLGDANLCALSWNEADYKHKNLANKTQTFVLRESCSQIVNRFTRIQKVGNQLQKSCLDHVTTNVPEKCSVPQVFPFGSSDHLPVMVTKFSREVKSQPKTIKKRNYKNFNVEHFLSDVNEHIEHVVNKSFDKVLHNQDINEARLCLVVSLDPSSTAMLL